ncbi:thiamine pyrophosphate-binding protein [Microbulbifer sp. 2201CG32-9]|uniref:thiamine pyrophosphate-binding protein n=1 Tax=Microbulbifer sp. 2201CG32-9 TaxID=3232309 RepID=UPI00345B988F
MSSNLQTVTISTYLCCRLKALGVGHIFGIPGDYVLPFFDELIDGPHGVEHILVCNELNGAYAADGYAKVTGFGAMAVTFGVGSFSTINAVAGAFADSTPLIVIAGAPTVQVLTTPTERKLHHAMDTNFDACVEAFRPITVASHRLMSVATAPREIDEILRIAYQKKKPVYLEIPYDLQTEQVPLSGEPVDLILNQSSDKNLRAAVEATREILQKAKTRAIVAGHLLQRESLVSEAKGLVKSLNAAVATTFVGKIADLEGDSNAAGLYMGGMSNEVTRKAVEGADATIALGMTLNEFDTGIFTARLEGESCIWADFDKVTIGSRVFDKVYLRQFVPDLLSCCKNISEGNLNIGKGRRFYFERADKFTSTEKPLRIDRLFVQFANFFKSGDLVFGDTGGYINAAQAEFPSGVDIFGCGNYGSLGSGFGMFTGAVFSHQAAKRRRYIITGDGAFHMTAQEVSTLIKYGIDCVIFILDNQGYGAERQIYPGKERSYNNTPVWAYESLGQAMGGTEGRNTTGYIAATEKEMDAIFAQLTEPVGVNIVRIKLDPWDSASYNVKFSQALRH